MKTRTKTRTVPARAGGPGPQRGTTLIEVLVTLVLISVGLLGVAALQLTSLRSNQEAYVRSQASALAADILDRMRSNQVGVLKGDYAVNGVAAIPDGKGAAGTVAEADLTAWIAAIDATLPGNPTGAVALSNGRVVTVTIGWGEREDHANNLAAQFVTFMTRTEI